MKTIWKFVADLDDIVSVAMPADADVLHAIASAAGRRQPTVTFWAVVDPDEPTEIRTFYVRGTGHPLGLVGRHIATSLDGPFVWHIFKGAP